LPHWLECECQDIVVGYKYKHLAQQWGLITSQWSYRLELQYKSFFQFFSSVFSFLFHLASWLAGTLFLFMQP
jgi:hypothetical protein